MALLEYKCPNCGGAVKFDAEKQELACPYCQSVIDMEALKAMEEEASQSQEPETADWGYEGGQWREGEQQGMAVYACNTCGGQIVGDETLGATSCPFCGTPVVMTSKFSGTLRPDMLIPFKLDKNAALAALQKHYLKKKLLPPVFKDRSHLDEVKGVYVPFWLFDADTDAHIEYSATKIRSWSDKDYIYKETSVYRVIREGGIGFSQVPVDGSSAIDDTLMESIEPFTMKEAVDFKGAYLAGYLANKYDVDANECTPRANERIKNSTASEFAKTVLGYSTVTPQRTSIKLKSGAVRYAMFPVWLLSTRWKGQQFAFAMNGQTGKFVGDLPLDKGAFWRWFFTIFGITAAVTFTVFQLNPKFFLPIFESIGSGILEVLVLFLELIGGLIEGVFE
ncbi:MAG: TFIIB-type zinc ribbon-containing protein [Synergistaceae bacterium]|nr:TFIIB-type zinc ribbon-containing protein [Synergistaceae bacterium]